MKILTSIVPIFVVLAILFKASQALQCNASHFALTNQYTLGKQDELNRTFTLLNDKIKTIGNVTFDPLQHTTYTIFNAKPHFFYIDSKQSGEILGNDTIVIKGGHLDVQIDFQWQKNGSVIVNGTGKAFGRSDQIIFVKEIVLSNDSFYKFELLDYQNVTWSNGQALKLFRVDPPNSSQEDKQILTKMLNNIMGVKTLRFQLEQQIDVYYSYYLSNCLHDEHMPINDHFDYVWEDFWSKMNYTLPFSRKPLTVDIEKAGIEQSFDIQVKNATHWKCGRRDVPILPINPSVYGGTQQFISYDFYQNVIRYAISNEIINTDLDERGWGSRMFQFFAGDLYEVIPKVQSQFYASQEVVGNCKSTDAGLNVWKASTKSFNVSIHYDCQLSINRSKVADFAIGLTLQIEGHPKHKQLDFVIKRHQQFVSFYPYQDYKIENQPLAKAMVAHSLNRLYDNPLFGSNWPQSPPRDYPNFMAEENYTVVYDTTHVEMSHQ